jgi:hypothetical protein
MHHGGDANPKLYSVLPLGPDHDGQLQAARWFVNQVKITTGLSSRGIMFSSPSGLGGANVEIMSHGYWNFSRCPAVYVNGIYCDPPA